MADFFKSVKLVEPMGARAAFYGGRTNAIKLYHFVRQASVSTMSTCAVCTHGSAKPVFSLWATPRLLPKISMTWKTNFCAIPIAPSFLKCAQKITAYVVYSKRSVYPNYCTLPFGYWILFRFHRYWWWVFQNKYMLRNQITRSWI